MQGAWRMWQELSQSIRRICKKKKKKQSLTCLCELCCVNSMRLWAVMCVQEMWCACWVWGLVWVCIYFGFRDQYLFWGLCLFLGLMSVFIQGFGIRFVFRLWPAYTFEIRECEDRVICTTCDPSTIGLTVFKGMVYANCRYMLNI